MTTEFKSDLFESEVAFTLEEANGEVDGQHVIGKVSGTFFVPNGKSRNKRYYTKSLWEKTLSRPEIQSRLKNKQMIGTIGHEQILDDDAVLQGKVSHITTKLSVDADGKGVGEALILGTPSGHILKTMCGAGVKMFTSSRALGGYKGEFEGLPVVDETKYRLKGFDFVLDPGFLEANPSLIESLKESMDILQSIETTPYKPESTKSITEENNMSVSADKELLENFVRENNSLKKDLDGSLTENETLKSSVGEIKEELETLKTNAKNAEGLTEKLAASDVTVAELQEKLKAYEELGTVEEIDTALTEGKELVSQYKAFGAPSEIEEALTQAKDKIVEYKKLGSVEEIDTAFERMREINKKRKGEKNDTRAEEFAKEIGAPVEAVKKVYEHISEDEIKEMFKDVVQTKRAGDRFAKTTSKVTEKKDGEEERPRYFDKDNATRLQESFK
jgi:hypothetical protein